MTAASRSVRIQIELDTPEAWALAQFVKRALWDDYRRRAIDDLEAEQMREAADAIGHALAEIGVAPR